MLPDVVIEEFLLVSGDDVPRLGLSEVVVVDGVDEEVLDVPAKCLELHPHVHPRQRNP